MRSDPSSSDPLLSLHTFAVSGHQYAVEPLTGSGFGLDDGVAQALAELRGAAPQARPALESFAESHFPQEIVGRLDGLRERLLRYAEAAKKLRWDEAGQRSPRSVEFCLCATYRCNLACEYCFVRRRGLDRSDARGDMTLETAKAAVDFALAKLPVPTRELIVSFGHTGEPLLLRDMYEEIGDYVRRRATETNRRVAYGMAATNFTLAHTAPLPNLSWPSISLDGPREVHDRVRITPTGQGTYDSIVPSLQRLLAASSPEAAETNIAATLTARSADIKGIFLHLASLGAPYVTMYPVRMPPDSDLAITETTAADLLAGYDALLQHLLALEDAPLTDSLKRMVHGQDYFGRHVLRVALRHRVRRRCDAGIGMVAVTPDGALFPCPELAALGERCIGSIRDGLDEPSMERLRSRSLWDSDTCAACWARLLCGGDCLSNRAMYQPFGTPPDPGMCAFTRGLIERATHLVTRLRETRPEVLAAVLKARAGWLMEAAPAGDSPPPPPE
jgi:uncharacterized protein